MSGGASPRVPKRIGGGSAAGLPVSGNFPVAMLLGGKGLSKGQKAPDPLEISPLEASKPVTQINTGGGAYIKGDVNVPGGDFVGRDQIVYGDKVVEINREIRYR